MILSRLALNYKGVPYKTEWVEYPDIEALCKRLGAKPTAKRPDGTDYYSVPVIVDSSTNAVVADSWNIAVYLEETYPAPTYKALFPGSGTRVLQYAFNKAMFQVFPDELIQLVVYDTTKWLNPESRDYFYNKHSKIRGPIEELAPHDTQKREQVWERLRKNLDALSAEYDRNGEDTPFVMGNTLSYADFIPGGFIMWNKRVLSTGELEKFKSLNGGRWARWMEALEPYEAVV